MELRNVYLGSIDAKNELLSDSPEQREIFKKSFVIPPSLDVDKYLNRDRYFISGLKGTGKTALLRYLSICAEEFENSNVRSSFVLFKSEIDEDYKKGFTQAARSSVVENNSEGANNDDFEYVWRWFIYRKIVSLIENDSLEVFQKNSIYNEFRAIVNSPVSSDEKGTLSLLPKIKKGNIVISKTPELRLELDWSSSGETKIIFNDLVRKADQKFEELLPGIDGVNIYFDELELNYNSKKQYQRDARLIRDLIVTVARINAVCKQNSFDICLYSAIRSEVQNAVDALGKEINKILGDFGSEIMWHRPGIDSTQQPLLNIISKRLASASCVVDKKYSDDELWDIFFPKTIQNRKVQEYILHHSWYRPRDIVRLLKTAQDQYPNEKKFGHHIFDAIRKKYSELSWVEISEELKSKYKGEALEGVKRLLYGFKEKFSFHMLRDRADEISEFYPAVAELLREHKVASIISDLYRIGVVGNLSDGRFRFSFRGDHEVLLDQNCYLHRALRAYLSV